MKKFSFWMLAAALRYTKTEQQKFFKSITLLTN